ncbi:hypothetical protein AMS68_000372 [Peltaster fructicola]|uniref:DUF7908 domain-containing protein n=1 Tax=Peltaster fructicola TaxID=286661 RepID=A0A6H0XJQ8_9PEZI|nr:hypothetical protein AMS68_000372 [Peltaster fructicola]
MEKLWKVFFTTIAFSSLGGCQRSCQEIGSSSLLYEQAVSINTEVLTNTTFNPIPQVALTVTDAPTSIDTITTLTWTSTVPVQHADTPLPSTFVLISGQQGKQKRQSGTTYIAPGGTLTQDCAYAVQYSIVNGQLIANASDGTIYYYSTSPGVAYSPFVATTVPGSISTTFNITEAFILTWRNTQFYNGEASFCSVDGSIYAVFQQGEEPDGCFFAPLSPAYGPGCVLWGNSGARQTNADMSFDKVLLL